MSDFLSRVVARAAGRPVADAPLLRPLARGYGSEEPGPAELIEEDMEISAPSVDQAKHVALPTTDPTASGRPQAEAARPAAPAPPAAQDQVALAQAASPMLRQHDDAADRLSRPQRPERASTLPVPPSSPVARAVQPAAAPEPSEQARPLSRSRQPESVAPAPPARKPHATEETDKVPARSALPPSDEASLFRSPLIEPFRETRPRDPLREAQSREGGRSEGPLVSIGRIEIEIAPPAPQPRDERPRTRGFQSYARLRRGLDR